MVCLLQPDRPMSLNMLASLESGLFLWSIFLLQMTPFHVAAERGRCEEILGYLIDKGGDTSINIKDEDGVCKCVPACTGKNWGLI